MTRTRWLIAASWLLLFWLLAGTVWAPAIQRELTLRAAALVPVERDNHAPVSVTFEGQHATLAGKVRHAKERERAELQVRGHVRTATFLATPGGAALNPVTGVTNQIEIVPFPSGWLMLEAWGKAARLSGVAAHEFEARDSAAQILERWTAQGGRLENDVIIAPARFDEAPATEKTLATLPTPRTAGADSAQVQIARLGSDWQRLMLDAPDERLREQTLALGLTETEWTQQVLPALRTARHYQKTERLREAETQRQASLPPPHVFLAARDKRVLLRGELASLALKRELLNATITAFPDWKVLDDIRINPKRRSTADFGPITTALLPSSPSIKEGDPAAGKALSLGLPGLSWQMLDLQAGGDPAQLWLSALPKDLPADLVTTDGKFAAEWLRGNFLGIPRMPLRAQPSFLTLTLLPERVILAGQLAEESLRTQLIEAAERAYGPRAVVISDGLLARGTCEPSADVEQTSRSLPPLPAPGQAAVLAFTRPGQVWKTAAATPALLAAGGLAKSALLPKDFPAPMAEDTFADAFDHVRDQWQKDAANPPAPPAAPASR